MSSFKVTLLGTGSPEPLRDRLGPSILVESGETKLLFDCGRGTMQRIYQREPDASTYDKLFLTHLHSDHISGIPDLWITGHLLQRNTPLKIWGPKGTKEMTNHLRETYQADLRMRKEAKRYFNNSSPDEGFLFQVEEIDEGFVYEENGVRVTPFRVNHLSMYSDEPCLGYRVEYQGRSLVVSGDTCYCENLIEYSRGVDLLIHEVAAVPVGAEIPEYLRNGVGIHATPEDCGKVFNVVQPKLAVFYHVLNFLGTTYDDILRRTRDVYDGYVILGEDMMEIEVDEQVKILNQ